jgi:hypothetical protein
MLLFGIGSKVLVGDVELICVWIEKDGVTFSNGSFVPRETIEACF